MNEATSKVMTRIVGRWVWCGSILHGHGIAIQVVVRMTSSDNCRIVDSMDTTPPAKVSQLLAKVSQLPRHLSDTHKIDNRGKVDQVS